MASFYGHVCYTVNMLGNTYHFECVLAMNKFVFVGFLKTILWPTVEIIFLYCYCWEKESGLELVNIFMYCITGFWGTSFVCLN